MSEIVEHHPPLSADRRVVEAPVRDVSLLEDRGQVTRRGAVVLTAGLNRLAVLGVAPVIQDVSLQASAGPAAPGAAAARAHVADVRVVRAARVTRAQQPEAVKVIDAELQRLEDEAARLERDRVRLESQRDRFVEILAHAVQEIPEDAGWGLVDVAQWRETIAQVSARHGELVRQIWDTWGEQRELAAKHQQQNAQRTVAARPNSQVVARLEVDVWADEAGTVELTLGYVVPAAIWRPLHRARLGDDGRLEVVSQAVAWQATGEDWHEVKLSFSTARSSLGHEAPLLGDDLLVAQRRSESVVVAAREVKINQASVGGPSGGAAAAPSTVELPGVDDGGETRTLVAPDLASVPADGAPYVVPLSRFEVPATVEWVCLPEQEDKVFVRARADNGGRSPLLAGPVELIRESGVVGWSKVLFVAPGERFELSFGPDDALRVVRREDTESAVDDVDRWRVTAHVVRVYLSHLGGEARTVEVVERIPVSEIDHVRVTLLASKCQPQPVVDDHGFCRWTVPLRPNGRAELQLAFGIALAPTVQGV